MAGLEKTQVRDEPVAVEVLDVYVVSASEAGFSTESVGVKISDITS